MMASALRRVRYGECDGCEGNVANEVLRVLVCECEIMNAGGCGSLLAHFHFLRLALSLVRALFVSARGLSVSGMSVASERGMVVGDGPVCSRACCAALVAACCKASSPSAVFKKEACTNDKA